MQSVPALFRRVRTRYVVPVLLLLGLADAAAGECAPQPLDAVTLENVSIGPLAPGNDLDISADGAVAALADEGDDGVAVSTGAVHLFERRDATWTLLQKVVAPDAAESDRFGVSAALSTNGSVLLVGAYHDDDVALNGGSAYVFAREGDTWMFQAKLTAPDGADFDEFGSAVALSGDGTRAVVAARLHDGAENDVGAVYVFEDQGGVWMLQTTLAPPIAAPNVEFGTTVDLSDDGQTMLIASPGTIEVHILGLAGGAWAIEATLVNEVEPGIFGFSFGHSAVLSADGMTAVVAAPFEQPNAVNFGTVSMFRRVNGSWIRLAKFDEPESSVDNFFGLSVAVSGDGRLALAGFLENFGDSVGGAHVYALNGTTWSRVGELESADPAATRHGFRVDLSSDGGTGVVRGVHADPAFINVIDQFYDVASCSGSIADTNGDGTVDVVDLLAVLAGWGACPDQCPPSCTGDTNDDCSVDVTDFLAVLANWG